MSGTLLRLVGPLQLGTVAADVFTAPGAVQTAIRNIHVSNTSAAAARFFLSIGAYVDGTSYYPGITIPAHGVLDQDVLMSLSAAETLQAYSDTATALTLTISGVLLT